LEGRGEHKRRGVKKRPSVETEGRLTIACHMKNLKDRCCRCTALVCSSGSAGSALWT
jgi:hypothetical protein